jgi:hypothetical protein
MLAASFTILCLQENVENTGSGCKFRAYQSSSQNPKNSACKQAIEPPETSIFFFPHNDVALDDNIIFFLTTIFYVKGCNHTLMGVPTSVTSAWFFMLTNFVTSHEIESLESPDDEIRNLCTRQNS